MNDITRTSKELRLCPFCGGKPFSSWEPGQQYQHYYVTCLTCQADGPWCKTAEEAEAGWNRRASNEPPAALQAVQTMFRAAVSSLAEISQALDIPDHVASVANGNTEILKAIAHLKGVAQPPALDPIEASARARYIELHGLPAHDPWELAPSGTKEQYREWARNNTPTKGGEQS